MTLQPYSLLMIACVGITLLFWRRLARNDTPLLFIYLIALAGAFVVAKVLYIASVGADG